MRSDLPADAQRLRALSHPIRIALLQHLASFGPATATECAQFVDASPSACSWHLRALAKAGWIEPGSSANGRERPWRYVANYANTLTAEPGNPVTDSVEASLLARSRRMEDAFLRRRSSLPPALAEMADFYFGVIWVSPMELTRIRKSLQELLQSYERINPADRPSDAVRMVTTWTGVPWLAREATESVPDSE